MCKKRSTVMCKTIWGNTFRVDPCIRDYIKELNFLGYHTVACCCGHGKYPLTVICKKKNGDFFELITHVNIPRTRNFYKTDSEGYYYIPEVSNQKVVKTKGY
jgi:hypothetical protein